MPPRSPFPLLTTSSESRTATLQGLLIGAIVIAALYVAARCCCRWPSPFC